MRLVGLQALYQNACNLLLDTFFGDVIIEVENHPRVEVCVAVNVSKLINNGVQEAHTSLWSKLLDNLFENLVAFLLQGLLL